MIVLYKGARGRGKTLTMVKDGYNYFNNAWKVLRNFKCGYGDYISNEDIIEIDKYSDIKDCVLMCDEIQIFFDSRRSMATENKNFSNFIQQIRKRNIILLCTTQYSNTIDLRLRQHTDIIAMPKYYEDFYVCKVRYYDMTTIEDSLVSGSFIQPEFIEIVYDARPVFSLFKTKEIIA